jgi:phosphatidylinositol glycan class U
LIFVDAANLALGDIAATVYLWNPFTIVSCVGGCTSPIENALVILSLFGAVAGQNHSYLLFVLGTRHMENLTLAKSFVTGNVPLSTFGWVVATHFSLYPAVLIIPVIMSLICIYHNKILILLCNIKK